MELDQLEQTPRANRNCAPKGEEALGTERLLRFRFSKKDDSFLDLTSLAQNLEFGKKKKRRKRNTQNTHTNITFEKKLDVKETEGKKSYRVISDKNDFRSFGRLVSMKRCQPTTSPQHGIKNTDFSLLQLLLFPKHVHSVFTPPPLLSGSCATGLIQVTVLCRQLPQACDVLHTFKKWASPRGAE